MKRWIALLSCLAIPAAFASPPADINIKKVTTQSDLIVVGTLIDIE